MNNPITRALPAQKTLAIEAARIVAHVRLENAIARLNAKLADSDPRAAQPAHQ